MFQSGGVLVKGVQEFTPASWNGIPQPGITLASWRYGMSYEAMYRRQLWVNVVISKRARATARLPLKVYERGSKGRTEATDHPYAQLLRNPYPGLSPWKFWLWVSSTYDTYGECFLGKLRDNGGRPNQLLPLHPTCMFRNDDGTWRYESGNFSIENIAAADLIPFTNYNPESLTRGLSSLEPLRDTLENEAAARTATSAFWRNGARPGVALSHPGKMTQQAADRLKVQWESLNSGASNTGKTVVLEEGMKPEILSLSAEEAQYIDTRKLNREEVCAAYDVPPPVVHILDRATFSNITEQMRSMYRDTMAPHLKAFESELETHLRAPDFGDEVYAEFLMDEVLRGDFEVRADAYQKAINSRWMMPSEVRELENLPFVEGSDQLLGNAALTPVTEVSPSDVRSVLGRLGRAEDIADVDPVALTKGLTDSTWITEELAEAQAKGLDLTQFRERLRSLGQGAS